MNFNRSAAFPAELEERIALLRLRGAPDEAISHARLHYIGIEKPAQVDDPTQNP